MHANWEDLAAVLRRVGMAVCPASGGYFLVADVSPTGLSDFQYVRWLATEHKVAAVPLSIFFASEQRPKSLVRFAVCKERATIRAAVAALEGATVESAKAASAAARAADEGASGAASPSKRPRLGGGA